MGTGPTSSSKHPHVEDILKEDLEGNDLEELKICRLFLKSTYLSEIITGNGKLIRVTAWNGTKNTARYRYEYPTHIKPNQKIWEKWQAAQQ